MKNDSPNKFMGGIAGAVGQVSTGNSSIMSGFLENNIAYQMAMERKRAQQATQAQQAAAASGVAGGTIGTAAQDPMTGGAMDQANPFEGKTFEIKPSNEMGNAAPLFKPGASNAAAKMYGTPLERQMSMPNSGPVTQMKDIPEGNKGAGLRALDDSVVEQMGYDAATKMVSPLNDNHPGRNSVGAKMVGKEIPKKMSKELTEKPRVPVVENSMRAFGVTKDGKKVNLGKITSTEIPEKDFKQR